MTKQYRFEVYRNRKFLGSIIASDIHHANYRAVAKFGAGISIRW